MSGVEVLSLALSALPFVTSTFRLAFRSGLVDLDQAYRRQRYGMVARVLSWLFIFDPASVQELHGNINTWNSEELKAWKESYIDSCNAIAVAVRFGDTRYVYIADDRRAPFLLVLD
jgi:hypothetical protein